MDYEDQSFSGLTVLDGIGIKTDEDYEESNQENQHIPTQNYGYGHLGYPLEPNQHPSSSTLLSGSQNIMEYSTINYCNTRGQIPRSMTSSEQQKLEKKRERNRIAATKCRQRKLEKIQTLEAQVKQLQKEKNSLAQVSHQLRQSIQDLQQQIDFHLRSGCQIAASPNCVYEKEEQYDMSSNQLTIRSQHGNFVCSTPGTSGESSNPSPLQYGGPDSTCTT